VLLSVDSFPVAFVSVGLVDVEDVELEHPDNNKQHSKTAETIIHPNLLIFSIIIPP
jgi:hypothetical protein